LTGSKDLSKPIHWQQNEGTTHFRGDASWIPLEQLKNGSWPGWVLCLSPVTMQPTSTLRAT